jgi:uncharacterized protein (DUF1684 family)
MTDVGTLRFSIGGKALALHAYIDSDDTAHLFVPFRDRTNGHGSYHAGRYLEIVRGATRRYVIDFNYAFNPYCAYNPDYTCPLVPSENVLDVPIEAGERFSEQGE